MSQFTSEWLRARQMKSEPKQATLLPTDAESESELHDMLISWCRRQDPQVAYIHSRMDKKSTIGVGVCDFTLFISEGRPLLVECKMPGKELDDDQKLFKAMVEANGHTLYVVHSYVEFLAILKLL